MMSSLSACQIFTTLDSFAINFMMHLGGPLAEMPQVAIGFISLVLYCVGIPFLFVNGGSVKKIVTKTLFATYVAAIANIILFMLIFAAGVVPR